MLLPHTGPPELELCALLLLLPLPLPLLLAEPEAMELELAEDAELADAVELDEAIPPIPAADGEAEEDGAPPWPDAAEPPKTSKFWVHAAKLPERSSAAASPAKASCRSFIAPS